MAATQEKSLSQFPTAAQILLTTLIFGSVVDATSTSGYDSVKILVSDLAEAILGDFAYTQDLATDAKTIFGAINSIRVLSGTATPNNSDGANGQIYVKYTSGTYAVVGLYVKLNDAWREISTGGGGGGASVQMGTTTPTSASGSDGDLYVQYDGTTYEVVAMFVKINGAWREIPLGGEVIITPIAVTSQMVTASSTVGSNFEGYRAFDGQSCNISTMQGGWLANANDNTPTLTVDFGTAQSLGRIAIETANNNNPDTTRDVYIEGSSDGSTWENILASGSTVSLVFEVGKYNEYSFNLNEGEYQYFRIRGTQPFFGGSFQYACCFSEITIYDKSAGVVDIYPDAIADEYDSTQTYTAGDYVMYGGKLYRCNHIGATGTWEPTWWDETSATDYTKSVNTALTTQINNIHDDTADAYSASSTYAVGDLCIAFGRLYRCTTAIATPEAWNSSHWAATTIADEIALKQNATDNSLNTTNKTVVGAINEVRNYNNLINKPTIPTKTSDLTNDSRFTVQTTVIWGTSITIKYIKSNFLLFVSNRLYVLWFYGSDYANVDMRYTGTDDVVSGAGTVTLGGVTVTRTSDGFSVTLSGNSTITVIG